MKREALLRERGDTGGNLASGNGKAKDVAAFQLSKFVSILSLKNTLFVFFRELLLFGVLNCQMWMQNPSHGFFKIFKNNSRF